MLCVHRQPPTVSARQTPGDDPVPDARLGTDDAYSPHRSVSYISDSTSPSTVAAVSSAVSTPLLGALTFPISVSPRTWVALEASCVTLAVTKAAVTASLLGLAPAAIAAVVAVNLAVDIGFVVLTHELTRLQSTLISLPLMVANVLFLSWISNTPVLEAFATVAVSFGLSLGVAAACVGLVFLGYRIMLFFISRQLAADHQDVPVAGHSADDTPTGMLFAESVFTAA